MTSRLLRTLLAPVAVMVVAMVLVAASSVSPARAANPASGEEPPPSFVENPFIPEERNLSDCVSAIPKPGCGSDAKGGTQQTLLLVVLVAGLGLIGWRIVAGVRKQRQ